MKQKHRTKTKMGLVHKNNKGYYRTSDNQLLHRKIWEEFYGQKIPKGYVIHHINEDVTDNRISNLQLMTHEEHLSHHHKGKPIHINSKIGLSQASSTTGYFRVTKKPCPRCIKGFMYRYMYYDVDGKRKAITSTSLKKLMLKVQAKNLPWKKLKRRKKVKK